MRPIGRGSLAEWRQFCTMTGMRWQVVGPVLRWSRPAGAPPSHRRRMRRLGSAPPISRSHAWGQEDARGQACNAEGTAYLSCDCTAGVAGDAASIVDGASSDGPTGTDAIGVDAKADASGSGDATSASDAADSSACKSSTPPAANSLTHLSDPTPTETTSSTGYVLHKVLNGYNNYGQGTGSSDILYYNGVGAWTFSIPRTPERSRRPLSLCPSTATTTGRAQPAAMGSTFGRAPASSRTRATSSMAPPTPPSSPTGYNSATPRR